MKKIFFFILFSYSLTSFSFINGVSKITNNLKKLEFDLRIGEAASVSGLSKITQQQISSLIDTSNSLMGMIKPQNLNKLRVQLSQGEAFGTGMNSEIINIVNRYRQAISEGKAVNPNIGRLNEIDSAAMYFSGLKNDEMILFIANALKYSDEASDVQKVLGNMLLSDSASVQSMLRLACNGCPTEIFANAIVGRVTTGGQKSSSIPVTSKGETINVEITKGVDSANKVQVSVKGDEAVVRGSLEDVLLMSHGDDATGISNVTNNIVVVDDVAMVTLSEQQAVSLVNSLIKPESLAMRSL